MAGLVFGGIAPHGGIVIRELAGDTPELAAVTRAAMEELGRRMLKAQPETVVVLTPHGIRVSGAACLMTTERAVGVLDDDQGVQKIAIDMAVDVELARQIAARAVEAYDVPVVTAIYGSSAGEACYTPLDWGAVIPLWFLGARWPQPPRIISVTPSRVLTLRQLYDFGTALAEAAEAAGRRVALIASADWGHAHDPHGPYGYDPASAKFDALAQEIVRSGQPDRFLDVSIEFADEAKVDGLWQAVTLAGAVHHTPLRGELLSYEAPTYFGMMVAAYEAAE